MKLVRTFHPVGHGAFYSEVLYDDNDIAIQTVVYDCGTLSKQKYLFQEIDELKRATMTDKIDALFISHFHTDHTSGIEYLSRVFDIERIFIPVLTDALLVESLFFNTINYAVNCTANRFLGSCRTGRRKYNKIIKIDTLEDFNNNKEPIHLDKVNQDEFNYPVIFSSPAYSEWVYIPYNIKNNSAEDLLDRLKNDKIFRLAFNRRGKVLIGKLKDIIKSNLGYCKKIYNSIYKGFHNSYSMTLYSGIGCNICRYILCPFCCNCLYMGDFEANPNYHRNNTNCDNLISFYKDYWDGIRLLQVPHHGSEHNLNADLYTPEKLCIMSVGVPDKFNHPDRITIDTIIAKQSIPIIVTEDSMTKQMFTYNLP